MWTFIFSGISFTPDTQWFPIDSGYLSFHRCSSYRPYFGLPDGVVMNTKTAYMTVKWKIWRHNSPRYGSFTGFIFFIIYAINRYSADLNSNAISVLKVEPRIALDFTFTWFFFRLDVFLHISLNFHLYCNRAQDNARGISLRKRGFIPALHDHPSHSCPRDTQREGQKRGQKGSKKAIFGHFLLGKMAYLAIKWVQKGSKKWPLWPQNGSNFRVSDGRTPHFSPIRGRGGGFHGIV